MARRGKPASAEGFCTRPQVIGHPLFNIVSFRAGGGDSPVLDRVLRSGENTDDGRAEARGSIDPILRQLHAPSAHGFVRDREIVANPGAVNDDPTGVGVALDAADERIGRNLRMASVRAAAPPRQTNGTILDLKAA